jgi:Rnl2 family RNA ligase
MSISHIPYPKMEQAKRAPQEFNNTLVVLLEKIHGTNFSIIYNQDGECLGMAKRTSILQDGEKFFNVQQLDDDLKTRMSIIARKLTDNCSGIVRFYGEYYGGNYNNTTSSGCVKIQKGMDYAPVNAFAVFDILVQLDDGTNVFLSWDAVKQITERFQVPHVPEVARGLWGNLKESFDIEGMTSRVPIELHGLATVENPESEGVIVRTLTPEYGERYKWKKAKYCETPKENRRNKGNQQKELINTICEWMNQNRFDAYMSKVGPEAFRERSSIGDHVKALVSDVMEDVQREYQDISESMRKSLWKPLSKRANGFVHSFRKTLEEQPIQVSKTEPEAPTLDTSTMSNDERIENLHRQHEGLLKEVQELTSQLERAEAWANRLTTM